MKIDKSLRTGDGGGGFYSFLWQPLNHNNLHIYTKLWTVPFT